MIRENLIEWRENLTADNYKQFLDEIAKLPEEDWECAAALWHHNDRRTIFPIIMAFHELDYYRNTVNLPSYQRSHNNFRRPDYS